MASISKDGFVQAAAQARRSAPGNVVALPVAVRLLADQLTPAVAYRRLVSQDLREAPSFLFESVENGDRVGRYSVMGAAPAVEVLARQHTVTLLDHRPGRPVGDREQTFERDDPLEVLRSWTRGFISGRRHVDALGRPMPKCA